ncbi:unnamed protein product [Caenorhabditis nigoni]
MNFQFDTNFQTINTIILNNLPDPNQGFKNSSIGSNVFDVIEKFFSKTQAPVCGSNIFILLKRYPNEADTSRLVSLIRSHHAIVHVITSATPSGGSQPKTLYSVASKTNGMGAFEYDERFSDAVCLIPIWGELYPVYATTIQVSGNGTKTIPDFYPHQSDRYWIGIAYQDHFPIDSFQNLNLRWTNPGDSGCFSVASSEVATNWNGGTLAGEWTGFIKVNYSISLDYNYSDQVVQNLQIRIYSETPLNNWPPYSD